MISASEGAPERSGADETVVELAALSRAMQARLTAGEPEAAAALAQVILLRYPRHLATYERLIQAAWMLQRWQEGEDWARRLLQADPGNAVAWRSLAFAVEQKGMLATARSVWRRAFQCHPYDPDIRSGLMRTHSGSGERLRLDDAALASLYLRAGRWSHAAGAYRKLVKAEPKRLDFQINWMVAAWQQGERREAYQLARRLTQQSRYTLMAWVVLAATGDVDDQALARHPIQSMDPDGEFVQMWLRIPWERPHISLRITSREAALLAESEPSKDSSVF
uniref:Tetratricopeptide repeat protein n=1 Tax=Caldilinea aerophila TaxID=133453 RepID=A0A7C1J8W4_9CHLR